jgi:subtilisin-like proprotein convertase family protein
LKKWAAMIGAGLFAAALVFGCGPNWDTLDPALGGAAGSAAADSGAADSGVACLAPTDCPGADTTCALRSCTARVCGTQLAAAGTSCTENGGRRCDGKGACVACLADTDCGTSTACTQYTCTADACPANPNLPLGTPCGTSALCDGAGTCVTCLPATVTMVSSANVPQAVPAGGATASTALVAGAVGTIDHVAVTLSLSGALVPSGDLSIALTSPGSTTLALAARNGAASTGNYGGITFDDAAPPPAARILYDTFSSGVAVPAAIPERNLSALMGESPNGTWQLQVANAGQVAGATLTSWSLQITAQPDNPPLATATLASTTALQIPHGGAIAPTLTASGLARSLYKATVTVMAPHPFSGRLSISLGSPGGKTIPLTSGIGGDVADVFADTTFDDGAMLLLGCTGAGCADGTGPISAVVPQGSLSALVADDPNGTWTLYVTDAGGTPAKHGMLNGWSLSLTPALCPMAPSAGRP